MYILKKKKTTKKGQKMNQTEFA